jgi:hypothetical protein
MRQKIFAVFVAVTGCVGLLAGAPAGGAGELGAAGADRWWEIRLSGQPTGYLHQSTEARPEGGGRTTQEMLFVVNRLGSKVEIKTHAETVEDAAGLMQSVHSESSSSRQSVVLDVTRAAGGLMLHSKAGAEAYDRVLPVSETLYGPLGIERLSRERLTAAGTSVSYATFAADFGVVVHYTRTAVGAGSFEGRPAMQVEEKNDMVPGTTKLWLGGDGALAQSVTEMPFGSMEMHPVERAAALRAASGSELRAESYDRTMARSNVRLPDPRSIEAIKLRLTQKRPDLGWPVFAGPGQRVLEQTPTTLILEVRRPPGGIVSSSAAGAASEPAAVVSSEAAFLAPNAILQSDDAEVVRLAHSIVGGDAARGAGEATLVERIAKVRKLQDWVAANVDLDLGVALAPASEVVRDRRGTCIAFAVLLASLERAAGIPSRIAMGMVYYEGIWGGHAWTEVALDGRWVPIDAAAWSPGSADAARIQFGSYTAEDNLAAANGAGMQMYGNVEVAVLEYTVHGRTVKVPDDARPYTVAGDVYANRWLGVAIRKPTAARFGSLAAAYPDSTLVAVEDGASRVDVAFEGRRVDRQTAIGHRLEEIGGAGAGAAAARGATASLGGRPAWAASGVGAGAQDAKASAGAGTSIRVRLVVPDGDSLWILTASGPRAQALLDAVASAWTWTPAS